jgi:ATP-dependent helicase HrpA
MSTELLPVTDEVLHDFCDSVYLTDQRTFGFVGETGSGKTTRVPPALFSRMLDPFQEIKILMPTRIAAINAATFVAQQMGVELGGLVGYRTGPKKLVSAATRITYMTVEYELMVQFFGTSENVIIVMDEIHNFSAVQESLLAWLMRELQSRRDFKLIIMSATLDIKSMSNYLGGCPFVIVAGRSFPLVWRTGHDPLRVAVRLLKSRKNVQMFVRGVPEITAMTEAIRKLIGSLAEIIPLHSELTLAEETLAFKSYSKPKCVISTNYGENSITIADIDAVVSDGSVRFEVMIDGIRTLVIAEMSQDAMRQQAGRASRTKPGQFWDCSGIPFDKRRRYQIPEIQRVSLGHLGLRFASVGVDFSDLRFKHLPNHANISRAYAQLKTLGALDANGEMTEIGTFMSRLPIDIQLARMVFEAQRLGVVAQVMTIAACIESKGIRDMSGADKTSADDNDWYSWKALTNETKSDLLAELDCFARASRMTTAERLVASIDEKRFSNAVEIREHLARSLMLAGIRDIDTSSDRSQILMACVAGLKDHVYRKAKDGFYTNTSGHLRKLARGNVIEDAGGGYIVGLPFSLEVIHQGEGQKVPKIKLVELILFPSVVPRGWIKEPIEGPRLARGERSSNRRSKRVLR